MKEKIQYYKELAKNVIQQKNKHLAKIEAINDCLFANKLSMPNLMAHKKLIQDLLYVINEKRDTIYLLQSENEIQQKELNFWVYDFEKLKLDKNIRQQLKDLNTQKMANNVNDEMSHKSIPETEKALLINADRYSVVSGHRNYFYDQKNFYINEIQRISELMDKAKYKKRNYKKSNLDMQSQMDREVARLEKDVDYFRDKICCLKNDTGTQTDLDSFEFNKIMKNNYLIKHQRRMTFNKLTNYIEKIKFQCTKLKPISKKSVLNFIPELYNEKMQSDTRLDLEGKIKMTLDEFFTTYMKDKFKMSKIIKKNTEQMIVSILKFSSEDQRVDLLRKFLGIGEDKIKREILDCYLTCLKNLPISYYKVFEDGENNYLMTFDSCMEIYLQKFPSFHLNIESLDRILRSCVIFKNEEIMENTSTERKKDLFFLMRYLAKSDFAFENLLNKFKNNIQNEEKDNNIADMIITSNREYELKLVQVIDLLKRIFTVIGDKVQLDTFVSFFIDKYTFKIKITDFMQQSYDCFGIIFNDLDKYLQKMWEIADFKRNGIIFYREFENVMNVLMGNSENKWKISEYFK